VDDAVERALERASVRLAEAAEGRVSPAAVDATLERARGALESLAQVSAELQEGLPGAIQDGLKEHFRPSARHLAEVRGLMNQMLRRLERLEGDLLSERHARVDDLALLVDLVASGWQAVNERLTKIEETLAPQGQVVELKRDSA
jgi:ABC-type transporter Mla subunit MlaD